MNPHFMHRGKVTSCHSATHASRTNTSSCHVHLQTSADIVRTVWATGERLPTLPSGSKDIGHPHKHGTNRSAMLFEERADGVPAFLAHFVLQARFECVRRKLLRVRDDTGTPRVPLATNDSLAKWDAMCNHVDHNEVRDPQRLAPYADGLGRYFRPLGTGAVHGHKATARGRRS